MSDYGDDDYSDDGDEWLYIEDEYMPADDLAEHAVYSPPPTAFGDDEEELDPFDYFIDLEYASDGYDDAKFYIHKPQTTQTGQKRKRGVASNRGKKKRKLGEGLAVEPLHQRLQLPPVVWRAQADRGTQPKFLDEDTEPYALLKDWRERLADAPGWATASASTDPKAPKSTKPRASILPELIAPTPESERGEDAGIEMDPAVLMAALQRNLAAAGGPLNGMDPQQLLQFAMRMINDENAGDDIAGELADDVLAQERGDSEDEGEAPADLLSWLSKHRDPAHTDSPGPSAMPAAALANSPEAGHTNGQPPTPPSFEAKHSDRAIMGQRNVKAKNAVAFENNDASLLAKPEAFARKRKAGEDLDVANSENAPKKRATRSYDAPTTASQARATNTVKATRSGRAKRS